jgi:hypothetical protein
MQLTLDTFEIFDSIEKQSRCVTTATRLLKRVINPGGAAADTLGRQINKVSDLERELLIYALEYMDQRCVTTFPYGREDVLRIMYRLQDVLQVLDQVANAIMRLGDFGRPPQLVQLGDILHSCGVALAQAIEAFGASVRVTEHVIAIDRLTWRAIRVARHSRAELINCTAGGELGNPENIYELIESVAYSFNAAARIIEDAVLKHREG